MLTVGNDYFQLHMIDIDQYIVLYDINLSIVLMPVGFNNSYYKCNNYKKWNLIICQKLV